VALTERQQQIKGLLDKGKTPKEVGDALGISENAVYQQRRRIKQASGNGSAPAKRTSARKNTRKTSTRKTSQRPARRQAPAAPATQVTTARPADPLSEVQRRKAEIDAQLSSAKTTLDEAAAAHETAQKAYDEAEGGVKQELERLTAVEALLTGKLQPPKPQAKRNRTTPAPAPAPAPAPEPEPEQIAAEAAAQDQAAEAPDEPTAVPASDNGSDEERPGVPTVPEFAQEDAFATTGPSE
jgi:hypothetical protein